MNVLGIVKTASGLVVSLGVGTVVGNLIRATTPVDINTFNKVMVMVGAFVSGGVLGEIAANHVVSLIDDTVVVIKEAKEIRNN